MIYHLHKVQLRTLPELSNWLGKVKDSRNENSSDYSMANILMQGIFMFDIHGGSRHRMNGRAKYGKYFKENLELYNEGMSFAHFDTVNNVLRNVDIKDLHKVRTKIVRKLIRSGIVRPFDGYFHGIFDGMAIASYTKPPCDRAIHKTKGAVTIFWRIIREDSFCVIQFMTLMIEFIHP